MHVANEALAVSSALLAKGNAGEFSLSRETDRAVAPKTHGSSAPPEPMQRSLLAISEIGEMDSSSASMERSTHEPNRHAFHPRDARQASNVMDRGPCSRADEPASAGIESAIDLSTALIDGAVPLNEWGRFLDNVETCWMPPRQVGRCLTESPRISSTNSQASKGIGRVERTQVGTRQ